MATFNADGSVTIGFYELMRMTETEPVDLTLELRVGDWVTVPGNAQGTVWESGHVERIARVAEPTWHNDDRYRIYVGYAARESSLPADYRAHATREFLTTREIGEIWRRRRVANDSEFTAPDGRRVAVIGSDYEWYRIR